MTEREVLIELEYIKMKLGNESPAFGTIVASDIRAALPHAQPSDNEVKMNDLLLIDYGVTYKGYMSDMTRTIWVGEPSDEMKKIYDLVMVALEEAVAAVKPGITAHELDAVARQVFFDAGVEQYSLRGLGHGVGLQIHENPRVVLNGEEVIEENMIFTIEPGLYLPGSAVANVTTTGVMTIPLMKQVGYKPEQAGAIEAVASTSGQVMPPIMGVGAFIMAEMTGIPYREIALAAIIPAVAYVVSLFILAGSIAKGNHFAQSALEKSIVIDRKSTRLNSSHVAIS